MQNIILEMIKRRNVGDICGIASYCTGNELVIEVVLERAKATHKPVLLEATANQVNQYGGYTGMTPEQFYAYVMKMAERTGTPKELVILGGDHLGPLIWQNEPENQAMEKSEELVRQFVSAGFIKIHLDTSMRLGDDPRDKELSNRVIAQRGVRLYQVAMEAFAQRRKRLPDSIRPVFIIGSEVPIPGGAQEAEESLSVTTPEKFEETVSVYQQCFREAGVESGFDDVIAVVVQPGVEFGDDQVFHYRRAEAAALCAALKTYQNICFEGHSTDYQSAKCLREMVEDGIAILKVGPALTFGLREALFSMTFIERELIPEKEQAKFDQILDATMMENPKYWENHYHGTTREIALARKYSYSDRCRYYFAQQNVIFAMNRLFDNLRSVEIPMNMLHQFMPYSYMRVRDGKIPLDPRALAKEGILQYIDDYEFATGISE